MNFKNKFKFADPETCAHIESIENEDDKCKRCNADITQEVRGLPRKSNIDPDHLYYRWYSVGPNALCYHRTCIKDRCSHCCKCRISLKEQIAEQFLEESYLRKMEVIGYPPEYYKENPNFEYTWQNQITGHFVPILVSNPGYHVVINNFDMGDKDE